jgi:hypothetical protein
MVMISAAISLTVFMLKDCHDSKAVSMCFKPERIKSLQYQDASDILNKYRRPIKKPARLLQ